MLPTIASERALRLNKNSQVPLANTVVALSIFLVILPAFAQSKPSEYDVKAAYLFNFGRFMRHSDGYTRRDTFDICILGHDPIGHTIDDIAANESIDKRTVQVVRVADVSATKSCTILFLPTSEGERLQEDLAILSGTDVLTVSDAPDFLKRGGMIQFLLLDNHVRFAVNLSSVSRAHLTLSSELLRVASSVIGKPPEEKRP
jgi:hypothetical protein